MSVVRVYVASAEAVHLGTPLLDIRVDLTGIAAQDCAPIFHLRLIVGEPATVDRLDVAKGQVVRSNDVIGAARAANHGAGERPLLTSVIEVPFDPLFDE